MVFIRDNFLLAYGKVCNLLCGKVTGGRGRPHSMSTCYGATAPPLSLRARPIGVRACLLFEGGQAVLKSLRMSKCGCPLPLPNPRNEEHKKTRLATCSAVWNQHLYVRNATAGVMPVIPRPRTGGQGMSLAFTVEIDDQAAHAVREVAQEKALRKGIQSKAVLS